MDQELPDHMRLCIRSIQMETQWEQGLKQRIDELAEYDPLDIQQTDEMEQDMALSREMIASIQQEMAGEPELTEKIHIHKHEEAKGMYDLLSEENGRKSIPNINQKA